MHCLCDISESVIGNTEHVKSVGLRRGLLTWEPREQRSVPCSTAADRDERMSSFKHVPPQWGQALGLGVGLVTGLREMYVWLM